MTLVSYAHDFIYLRTRKTASTSTEMYLQPFCQPPGREVVEFSPNPIVSKYGIVGRRRTDRSISLPQRLVDLTHRLRGTHRWVPHMSAERVKSQLDPAFWQRAVKISSVRNPFSRVVSTFFWSMNLRGIEIDGKAALIRKFRQHVESGKFNDDRKTVMIDGAFVPDVLIRQEYLATDLSALAEKLGLDTSKTTLPMTKKTRSSEASERPSIRELYDDTTANIVRRRFAWAFEHGKYSLELPE